MMKPEAKDPLLHVVIALKDFLRSCFQDATAPEGTGDCGAEL